eukprot:TRINITY_DN48791_c0_g2_i2.p1 TRINITY_DN48791_c0_g2~~TRINITY_DN48791_c0_g2_i2.p1  ORF type:complete len:167 (-),score=10.77 TRINITY_DN48791_c0_g2_i2:216-716(-)
MRFVALMSHYKCTKQLKAQTDAFVDGVRCMIDESWLRMFTADELGLLVSGTRHIDLADLRANTVYTNGYSSTHPLIRWLWDVLDELDVNQQSEFLRFATSCSRAPLLGFRSLDPKFCIQHVGNQQDTLPTSSTCMNLLRLPRYMSRDLLKQKILYAIQHSQGFGLT